jgi:hypothetical protein
MGRCPTKSLNDSSQGGGDVWYPLESGHQEGGIGVLEMSAYTTSGLNFGEISAQFSSLMCQKETLTPPARVPKSSDLFFRQMLFGIAVTGFVKSIC